ncbi:MAG: hypothetical protein RI974_260 [Actinomycetota bacterium]|jgi:uncharacterized protein (TIGR02611 family)
MEWLKRVLSKLPHPVRWVLTVVIGSLMLIGGLLGLVLPVIPGWVLIFLGIAILALELEWARELNKQGQQGLERIVAKFKSWFKRKKS